MRFDTRNMTPQQVADAERQLNERMMGRSNQPFTGQPKSPMQPQVQQVQLPMGGFPGMGQQQMPPMQPQVQQPARQLSPVRQYLNAMQQYRQGGRQGVMPTYAQFRQPQPGQQLGGIAGGGTGMPPMPTKSLLEQLGYTPGQQLGGMPGQQLGGMPMSDPFRPQISGGPVGGGFGPGVNNYSAPQPMPDPFKPQISGGPIGIAGGGTGMPPIGQPMDQQRQPGMVQSPEMQAYYAQDAANQAQRSQMMQQAAMQAGQGASPMGGTPSYSTAGGAGTTPTGGFGNMMDRFQQVQQLVGPPMSDPFKPQISGGPVGQPMGVAGGVGTPPQPNQPPMPMKKGGFAAKPVWDKERPEDLNKPKSQSVKKKKAAKARAKAAGRVYPNLVDNMAAARKKGK